MVKHLTIDLVAENKTFTRDGEITPYVVYSVTINGISVRLKPVDSTARAILESEFAAKGKVL